MAPALLRSAKTAFAGVAVTCALLAGVPCAAQSADPIERLERASIALVYIDNSEFGVGFVVASNGTSSYVLTAAHVLGCADTDKVGCRDTVKVRFIGELSATTGTKVLAWKNIDDGTDVALVRIERGNLTPVPVLSRTATDDEFYVIGFSARIITSSDRFGGAPEVHDGNISRIQSAEAQNLLEVSVPAYPGFSGGPIVDKTTHAVVGVFSGHLKPEDQNQIDYVGVGPAVILKFLAAAQALTHVPFVQISTETTSEAVAAAPADPLAQVTAPVIVQRAGAAADAATAATPALTGSSDPADEFLVAIKYQNGNGVEPDRRAALQWLQKAADANYPPALTSLGNAFANGQGVTRDAARALALFREAASLGDSTAAFICGRAYHYGKLGVKPDEGESQVWYAKGFAAASAASEKGDAAATWTLADAYFNATGVARDAAKAVMLLQLASERGSAGATNNLALMYLNGRNVVRDTVKGVALLTKSAQLGGPRSALALSNIYFRGEYGVQPDADKGRQFLEEAAALGNVQAMLKLGMDSLSGYRVRQNTAVAGTWFRRAAALGYLPGVTQYGRWLLETAPAAGRDPVQGLALLEEAASKGWNGAQWYLGGYYRAGRYVPQDYTKAFAYYRQAAQGGEIRAQFDLGQAYELGQGIAPSAEQARYWYQLAANGGDAAAKRKLGLALR